MQNSGNNYYDDKWNLFMEKIFGREWWKDSNIWSMKINDKYYKSNKINEMKRDKSGKFRKNSV